MKKRKFIAIIIVLIMALSVAPSTAKTTENKALALFLGTVAEKAGCDADLTSLEQAGVLTTAERLFILETNCITPAFAWRVVLPLYDIYPYPAFCYSAIRTYGDCRGAYQEARAAAITMGLASEDENANRVMSVKEVNQLFAKLDSGMYQHPKITTGCKYVDEVETWTRDTSIGRNSLIKAWLKVPENWKRDFETQGWTINFSLPEKFNTEQGEMYANEATGLTSYKDKIISIASTSTGTTYHEFGHYISYRMNWEDRLQDVFASEYENSKDVLRDYARTNAHEFIAEVVKEWVNNPMEDARNKLRSKLPLATAMVEEMLLFEAA